MSLKAKYCSQCGHAVAARLVGDRPRLVCSQCETIHYENPLPVAASIVFNDRREILLVRRANDPHKGEWCLPMGFAEVGETISQAALRELQEEAGITARPRRLIDADSMDSAHYGDLLIVTFEMEKTGGAECAGDDASEVRYFPIGWHPTLAFNSNERALKRCVAAHLEDWEIQDSFVMLQGEPGHTLLSDALVETIEHGAKEIAAHWLADIQSNPTTPSYRTLAAQHLRDRAMVAVSQFGRWFQGDETASEVRAFYEAVGYERRAQGFPIHEVVSSLTLLKKHVWMYACTQRFRDRPIEAYRILELSQRMALFFDRAVYHATRAYDARPAT